MSFDANSGTFRLEYNVDKSIVAPTLIYVNSMWNYPNGYTISFTPANAATYKNIDKNHIAITPAASTPDGSHITVLIQRNSN